MYGVVALLMCCTILAIPLGQLPQASPVKCSSKNLRGNDEGTGAIVTWHSAGSALGIVAVIVAVPSAMAVTRPVVSTVAILGSLDVQSTSALRPSGVITAVSVCVW